MTGTKVVLVTGGSGSIGRAIACKYADMGFSVIVSYHESETSASSVVDEIRAKGSRADKIRADITDLDEVKKMFEQVSERFGRLDVLVNSAGWTVYVPPEKPDLISEDIFDRIIDVNVKGLFFCCRQAHALMDNTADALIINISSTSAVTGTGSNLVYCASKAAVTTLTKSFARAYAPSIRVNAIAPGYVNTDFMSQVPVSVIKMEKEKNLMGRIGVPEDVSAVAGSMYSRMGYITGQVIILDGGASL